MHFNILCDLIDLLRISALVILFFFPILQEASGHEDGEDADGEEEDFDMEGEETSEGSDSDELDEKGEII